VCRCLEKAPVNVGRGNAAESALPRVLKRGDAFAFYAGDIRRTTMYVYSIGQLRGTADARHVRVRAETALAAFTTPSSGAWIMFGKNPS
jgi:hypothetical protein